MNKNFKIKDSEKKRILDLHINATKSHYIMEANEEIISNYDNVWDYKKDENGVYYAKRKGTNNWIQARGYALKAIASKVFKKNSTPNATISNVSNVRLDLNDNEQLAMYSKICQEFINGRSHNYLGITGDMLASAAKNAYNNYNEYVPPELSLAQLAMEGGFASNRRAKPIRTNNPYNYNNGPGREHKFGSVMDGIQAYYNLIAKNYLSGGKNYMSLLNNFVNVSGRRYAGEADYEEKLKGLVSKIKGISSKYYSKLKSR